MEQSSWEARGCSHETSSQKENTSSSPHPRSYNSTQTGSYPRTRPGYPSSQTSLDGIHPLTNPPTSRSGSNSFPDIFCSPMSEYNARQCNKAAGSDPWRRCNTGHRRWSRRRLSVRARTTGFLSASQRETRVAAFWGCNGLGPWALGRRMSRGKSEWSPWGKCRLWWS